MFLHGDGSFVTYLAFFMSLRGILDVDVHATEVKALDGMITGSDEEAALVKAVRVAFPNSRQLYCVLHCQDNVRDYMTKTGININMFLHKQQSIDIFIDSSLLYIFIQCCREIKFVIYHGSAA